MQTEKLSSEEIATLKKMLEKNIKKFYKYSSWMIIGFIIFSLIPISFLPKSNRMDDTYDKSQNLIQALGFNLWAIIVAVLLTILIMAIFADLKIRPLRKDIEEGLKLFDVFKVKEVVIAPSQNIYAIILHSDNVKKLVHNISPEQKHNYFVGQIFNLWILKNSKIIWK